MLKKTLMTAAAALAITAGATTISTPNANAGVKLNLSFGGGWGGYYGGHYRYRYRYYGHRHYRTRYYGHHGW